MKIRLLSVLFFGLAICSLENVFAQQDSLKKPIVPQDSLPVVKTYKIGIFAPLYLDSVFSTEGKFRYKQSMPKFVTPGLDFVNGAQLALDSMKLSPNQRIQAFIYDTKSYKLPVDKLISSHQLDSLDLIVGSVKDIEYKQLADFGLKQTIPFISATYPNDGGITSNPFLVVVNSTLKAHCEAIYGFLLQNYGTDKILLVRKKGQQEDKIESYFKMINEPDNKPLLNLQILTVDSSITADQLRKKLDTSLQTIIVGGSLVENFAMDLTAACYDLRDRYTITLVGMPNWDNFKSLVKKDQFEDFPVYFTTPYYNNKLDDYSRMLMTGYAKKNKGKPNDMVFKGFESTYLFTSLLMAYPGDIMNHLNDKQFKIFSDYNFRPVMLKKGNTIPDYFENKHVYFIRILNGTVSKAW